MKTIFYSKDAQFELTEEEYQLAIISWDKGKRCFIKRLSVSLSPLYIWAGDKPENPDRKKNRDGQWCIKKFDQWYLENNPDIKVNLRYYPELEDISDKKQIETSKYAKQLTNR